jgi:hypothetical protein
MRTKNIWQETTESLESNHKTALRVMYDAGEEENYRVLRRDIVEALDDEGVEETLEALEAQDLVAEVGKLNRQERGDDGGVYRVVHRRFNLTERGVKLFNAVGRELEIEEPPETTEPQKKQVTPDSEQWRKNSEWLRWSDDVEQILDETESVEYIDESHQHGADGTIVVTLERDGEPVTVRFSMAQWKHSRGREFYKEYCRGVPRSLQPDLSERDFGVLQSRWLDHYQDAHGDESEEETTNGPEEADTPDADGTDQDSEHESDQVMTKSERVERYLTEHGTDDSIRTIADELDVSTGTVSNAKAAFGSESGV